MNEEIAIGPAFAALTDRRRKFVWAMVSNPFGSQADWAREAGYSDSSDGAKVRAHHILQDSRVQAAALEVSRATLGAIGPVLAARGLLDIAADKTHPQHVKALELIANRVGLHETQRVEVVHRDLTGEALIERVRMLEAKYGLLKDVSREAPALASDGGVSAPRVIEHKADE